MAYIIELTSFTSVAQLLIYDWHIPRSLLLEVLIGTGIAWGATPDPRQAFEWLRVKVRALFDKYDRRYASYLAARHRNLDVKGLTSRIIYPVALEQVFVELNVLPKPTYQASKVLAQSQNALPEELRWRSRPVWDYLNATSPGCQHLVIIGPPGSGKTTLLKHIALTLIPGKKQRRHLQAISQTPFLLFLPEHSPAIVDNANYTLVQALRDSLRRWDSHLLIPAGWFEKRLAGNHCLTMLDGLNEVADPADRQKVVAWVARQMTIHRGNRFIVASRLPGYLDNPLEDATILEIRPFTASQINYFVERWYEAREVLSRQRDVSGSRAETGQKAKDLLARLNQTPPLLDLAANPLLLTMLATLHCDDISLPSQRVKLYAAFCRAFSTRPPQIGRFDLTPAQKQRGLQALAYQMALNDRLEISLAEVAALIETPLRQISPNTTPADFLQSVGNNNGLLLEREDSHYCFAHPTFQEYLAAVHVKENQLEAALAPQVGQSWWRETIRFYSAQTDDSTAIIAACLGDDEPTGLAVTLAIDCLKESSVVAPAARRQIEELLAEGVEAEDPGRRRLIAEALLARRLRRMSRVNGDISVDETLISHAEYQLFLDEERARGNYYQPDHWSDLQFPSGQGRVPAVGVRARDAQAFCDWLTVWAGGPWRYRLPQLGELETEIKPGAEVGYWVAPKEGCYQIAGVERSVRWRLKEGDRIHTFARDVDRDIVQDIVHALEHARDLAHDLDLDLDRLLDLALALDRARNREIDRILELAHDIAGALNSLLDRDIERDHDIAPDIAHVLELTLDFDRTLDHPSHHDFSFDLVRIRLLDFARMLDRARILALALDLARHRDRDRLLDQDFALDLDRMRDFVFEQDRVHVRDLNITQVVRHLLARNPYAIPETIRNLSQDWTEVSHFLRRYVRLWVLTQAASLRPSPASIAWGERWGLGETDSPQKADTSSLAEAYLELYNILIILELRVASKLPAWEGIRVVRERLPVGAYS